MNSYDLNNFPAIRFVGAMATHYKQKGFSVSEMGYSINQDGIKLVDGIASTTMKIETINLEPKIADLFGADFLNLVFELDVQLITKHGKPSNINRLNPIRTEDGKLHGKYQVHLSSFSNGKGEKYIDIADFDSKDNHGLNLIETVLEDIYLTESWIAQKISNINDELEQWSRLGDLVCRTHTKPSDDVEASQNLKYRFKFTHELHGEQIVLCEAENEHQATFEAWYSMARYVIHGEDQFDVDSRFEHFVEVLHNSERANTLAEMDLKEFCGSSIKMDSFEEINTDTYNTLLEVALGGTKSNLIYRPFE